MKKVLKFLLLIVIVLAVVYNLTLYYVDKNISKRVLNNSVYNNCHKIWSARGIYSNRYEQNSIKSLTKAIESGYIGFEIDFHYDIDMNRFIISHDYPTRDKNGKLHYTLKEGTLLTLQKLFEKVGKDHYFWLDYKNLDTLSRSDSLKAIKRLKEISKIYNIKDRIYLEGCTPWHLKYYENADFKTLFSFHPLPESSPFHSLSSNFFKILYYFSGSDALAMQYGKINDPQYSEITAKNLSSIPQFLFHVPLDDKLMKRLMDYKDIRVLLMGRDQSVDFGKVNTCKNR